jgi:acetyl esterase/lipase
MNKNKVSLRGRIIRSLIRFAMDFPLLRGTGFLENAARLSHMKRHWKAPKGYELRQFNVNGVPVDMLVKENGNKDKIILQFHGGAYIMRYFDYYRIIAYKYSRISKDASVVSIDYRTAPNHTFPDALNDALKVWDWLLDNGYKEENIIVVGDSAGGNLALSMTMKLRDDERKLPKALVLMSPWTDLNYEGESYIYNMYNDPLFGKKHGKKETKSETMHHQLRAYAGNTDYKYKYLSPAYGEFHHFPAMLIQVGSYEVLESDSIIVYRKAKQENVDVRLTRYFGMFHDFQMLLNFMPESKKAWKEVETFIQLYLFG